MTAEVFADAVYWIAMINPKDHWHSRAVSAKATIGDRAIVTTQEVLTEVLNTFAEHGHFAREAAARGVESALSASAVRVLPQSSATFAEGFALYRARPDKGHSLTDCISMAAMRREAITEVLTSDAHFR